MKSNNAPNPQFVRRIAVDDRERRSGVPAALANHPNLEVTIRRLKIGDYLIDDLIIERKTLFDFAKSVSDGRLFSQVARLARQRANRVCVILEGTSSVYPELSVPITALRGAMVTVAVIFCIPILRAATPSETADLILYAARQLQRRTFRSPRRFGANIGNLARQQRFMLQAIPEIGPVKAAALLRVFGSPAGVATATIEDLQTVDGIGAAAATKIHQVFHGE